MHRTVLIFIVAAVMTGVLASPVLEHTVVRAAETDALQLESKILLGDVRGRIDHMAIDIARQRLFVAELGNDSVGVVDLKNQKVLHRIVGLGEPQGLGYGPSTDLLYIANAVDGSVRLFQASDFFALGRIELGSDADNIRVDATTGRVFVGYGDGGLVAIDPTSRNKIADIPLKAHPESFQLDPDSSQIFVNVPDGRAIAVVDRDALKQTARWSTIGARANFPMALDRSSRRVLVVFRDPAKLSVFSMQDGTAVAEVATCDDSDDIFIDDKRRRVYVSCGNGYLDVFDGRGDDYGRVARIQTISGARTSLYVPELDRLLLGVPSSSGNAAAIWVYRPVP